MVVNCKCVKDSFKLKNRDGIRMANNEILSEIKKAEEDARKAVSEATEDKNQKVAKARADARLILEDGEEEAVKASQSALKSGEAEIHAQRSKIIEAGIRESESVAVKSQSNIPKAVDFLLEEFEREIRV
jgi:V/A-type H+-transporting ATPase subunit G/H